LGKKKGWINDFSVPFAIIEARNRLRGEKGGEEISERDVRSPVKGSLSQH
jgi:hypothetical protein